MTSNFWIIICLLPLVAVVLVALMNRKRDKPPKAANPSAVLLVVCGVLCAFGLMATLLYSGARRSEVAVTHMAISREGASVAISEGTVETIAISGELPDVKVTEPEPTPTKSNRKDLESRDRGSWLSRIASGGAVAVLITLAYLFLDAGTRGRYTWPLRFGSIVIFAGFCVLLWRLRPMISILEH
ncbi:MAG: hypothetical protein ACE5EC_05500 [Phycisphaerae bacterium]